MKIINAVAGTVLALGLLSSPIAIPNPAHASTDTNNFFTGTWSGHPNNIDLSPSLTGDMLFGYDNGCNYGEFTHTALVAQGSSYSNGLWDGPTIESTNTGTSNSVIKSGKQSNFKKYDAASLTFFSKSGYSFSGSAVVAKANTYSGPYNWMASYTSNTSWYCSKLVSRAVYDDNKYNLGFVVWGSFISPADVWYDSALKQRSKSLSSAYDGGSVWAKPTADAVTAMASSTSMAPSSQVQPTVSYMGTEVVTNNLNADAKNIVASRLNAEKFQGKNVNQTNVDNAIVLSDAKPGLMKYLSSLYHKGVSKKDIQKKWDLTADELAKIH